jgi:hypothetical protein
MTTASEKFMLDVAGEALRSPIPKQDFPTSVEQTNTDQEAIQYGAEYFWIISFSHAAAKLLLCHRQRGGELQKTGFLRPLCIAAQIKKGHGGPKDSAAAHATVWRSPSWVFARID